MSAFQAEFARLNRVRGSMCIEQKPELPLKVGHYKVVKLGDLRAGLPKWKKYYPNLAAFFISLKHPLGTSISLAYVSESRGAYYLPVYKETYYDDTFFPFLTFLQEWYETHVNPGIEISSDRYDSPTITLSGYVKIPDNCNSEIRDIINEHNTQAAAELDARRKRDETAAVSRAKALLTEKGYKVVKGT